MGADHWERCSLGERSHRGLARLSVAVCRRAVLVVPKGERPQPRRTFGRRGCLHDAADDDAVGNHVVIVVAAILLKVTAIRRACCKNASGRRLNVLTILRISKGSPTLKNAAGWACPEL